MSNNDQPAFNALSVFQAHFGTPPGSLDAKLECEKWESLCNKLLVDRERLRTELEKARLDKIYSEFKPEPTMEEVYAQVDRETTLEQIIAELEHAAEQKT
ncbi:MAG: hypothetical protein K2R98_10175 [Gemmataceae bacterium]|nr:hypothetical protein [Gemmataceae bacterium]